MTYDEWKFKTPKENPDRNLEDACGTIQSDLMIFLRHKLSHEDIHRVCDIVAARFETQLGLTQTNPY
jgi:hypothetical protein